VPDEELRVKSDAFRAKVKAAGSQAERDAIVRSEPNAEGYIAELASRGLSVPGARVTADTDRQLTGEGIAVKSVARKSPVEVAGTAADSQAVMGEVVTNVLRDAERQMAVGTDGYVLVAAPDRVAKSELVGGKPGYAPDDYPKWWRVIPDETVGTTYAFDAEQALRVTGALKAYDKSCRTDRGSTS